MAIPEMWQDYRGALDWGSVILTVVVAVIVGGTVAFIVSAIYHWYCWEYRAKLVDVEATLISMKHRRSTLQSHAVPTTVVTGDGGVGVGMGVVTTGEGEGFVTVWDCGKYGRLVADNEQIFRWAQEKSRLELRVLGDEARIESIYHD